MVRSPAGPARRAVAPSALGMGGHRAQRGAGADRQPGASVTVHPGQFANAAKSHQRLGLELAALHVRKEIGAAGDEHRVGAAIGQVLHGIADGARREVLEGRKANHDGSSAKGRTAMASAGAPNADSTTSGGLKVKSGTRSGPTRAVF